MTQKTDSDNITFFDLLILLSRRKKFILISTASLTALTAIALFLLPNQYTAEALVIPPERNSSMASTLMSQIDSTGLASFAGGGLGLKNPANMYVSLFRSQTVENAMIQRFGLLARYRAKRMSDARKRFERRTSVSLGIKDGLIQIKVSDTDPKMAADMANGYIEELRKLTSNLAISEASQRRLFFQQQLAEAQENLTKSEEALKECEQSSGVLQIDGQAKSLIEAAALTRAQIDAKQVQIRGMRTSDTDNNPELIIARQQLAELRAQLAKLGGAEQDSNSLLVPKGRLPEASLEYARRYRDVKYYGTIYEQVAKQFAIAKLDEAREGAVMQVADAAMPPDRNSFPPRVFITMVVMLLALIASGALAYVECKFAQSADNSKLSLAELISIFSKQTLQDISK